MPDVHPGHAVAYPRGVSLSFRARLEHASVPWLERMNRVPKPAALLVLLALLAVGIFAPSPWAGLAFVVIALFIGWLIFLTWQRLNLPERLMRFAVLALVIAVAVVRLLPRG